MGDYESPRVMGASGEATAPNSGLPIGEEGTSSVLIDPITIEQLKFQVVSRGLFGEVRSAVQLYIALRVATVATCRPPRVGGSF